MSTPLVNALTRIHRKDIELSDRHLGRTPFHSGYWVQRRIRSAIINIVGVARGTLLDIGCGLKPYQQFFEPFVDSYIGLEYSPDSGYRGNLADFCGDAAPLPLADASITSVGRHGHHHGSVCFPDPRCS